MDVKLEFATDFQSTTYLISKLFQLNSKHRHTGRDCRYPEHREVNLDCPPWLLDSGNPCRNDGFSLCRPE